MKLTTNPCPGHGCYDPDLGCLIPGSEHWYACPLQPDPGPADFEGWEAKHNAQEPDL